MAKETDKNKNKYFVQKNKEMIGTGKVQTVKEIVADGNTWKKESEKFTDYLKRMNQNEKPKSEVKVRLDERNREAIKMKQEPVKQAEFQKDNKRYAPDKDR